MKQGPGTTLYHHLMRIGRRACGCGRAMLHGWLKARATAAHPWLFAGDRATGRMT